MHTGGKSLNTLRNLFAECWKAVFPDDPPQFTSEGRIRDYSEDSRFFDPAPEQGPPSGQPSAGASGLSGPPPMASSSSFQLQRSSFTAPPSSPLPRASIPAFQLPMSSFANPPSSPAHTETPPRSPSLAPADTHMRSPSPAPAGSAPRPETPEGDRLIQYLRDHDYPFELQSNLPQISEGLIPELVATDPTGAIRVVFVENPEHRIPEQGDKPESFITKTAIDALTFRRIFAMFPKCIAKIEDPEATKDSVACYMSTWVSLYSKDKFYR